MGVLPLSFNDHPETTHEQVLASLAALDFASSRPQLSLSLLTAGRVLSLRSAISRI